jgi:hypothetical protein
MEEVVLEMAVFLLKMSSRSAQPVFHLFRDLKLSNYILNTFIYHKIAMTILNLIHL